MLGVLGVVALFASTIAVWARSTVLDSEKVANAVVDSLSQPEVADATATYVTDLVFEVVGVEDRVANLVPDALNPLEPAITGGIRTAVNEATQRLLARPEVLEIIDTAVQRAHEALVKLLRGDGLVDGITVSDGAISVNLLPVMSRALLGVQDLGLFDDVAIPELDRAGDPAEQIAALEDAFGRDLPDDFGQLVVYESESVANAEETVAAAQQAVALARRALVALLLLTPALLIGSAVAANRHRRAIVVLALSSMAVMVITRVLVRRVVDRAPQLVVDPGARAAVTSTLHDLTTGLLRATALVLIVSLLTSVFVWLSGSGETAIRLRTATVGSGQGLKGAVQRHPDGAAILLFGLAVLVLYIFGLSWLTFLGAGLLAVVGAALLKIASAAQEPESPSP